MNLVGRVMTTDKDSSKILPLLHEGFTVSAKVNEVNGATVMVSGDITLKSEGLCVVTRIPGNIILKPGQELVTSGEGGLFPAGIPIGVIETFDDSDPNNLKATLRPYAVISDIKDVFIMVPNEDVDPTKESAKDPASSESVEDPSGSSAETVPDTASGSAPASETTADTAPETPGEGE